MDFRNLRNLRFVPAASVLEQERIIMKQSDLSSFQEMLSWYCVDHLSFSLTHYKRGPIEGYNVPVEPEAKNGICEMALPGRLHPELNVGMIEAMTQLWKTLSPYFSDFADVATPVIEGFLLQTLLLHLFDKLSGKDVIIEPWVSRSIEIKRTFMEQRG